MLHVFISPFLELSVLAAATTSSGSEFHIYYHHGNTMKIQITYKIHIEICILYASIKKSAKNHCESSEVGGMECLMQ